MSKLSRSMNPWRNLLLIGALLPAMAAGMMGAVSAEPAEPYAVRVETTGPRAR